MAHKPLCLQSQGVAWIAASSRCAASLVRAVGLQHKQQGAMVKLRLGFW